MSDLSGKTLGQYQVIKPIGQGGMAKIYLAYQTSIKREVAIKVMSSPLQESAGSIKRFAQEVEVIAHLQHPQIIPVYDFGEHDDQIYIVMAYIRGGTLADRIEQAPNGLPDREIIRLHPNQATAFPTSLKYNEGFGEVVLANARRFDEDQPIIGH